MDLTIIESIQSVRTPFFDAVFGFLTDLGEIKGLIILFALLYWLYDKRFAVNFAFSYLVVAVFNSLALKSIFRRPRPLAVSSKYPPYAGYPSSYSFPSGHSAAASTMATYSIAESKKKKWHFVIILCSMVMFCLVIMFSRMYLGVHYLTDVIVGALVGFAISFVLYKFVNIKVGKVFAWLLCILPVYILILLLTTIPSSISAGVSGGMVEMITCMGSVVVSLILGINIEHKFIKYDPQAYKNKWIKLAVGLPILIGYLFFVTYVGGSHLFVAVQYFGYGLIVTCLVPWILSKLKGKNKMISKSEKDTFDLGKSLAKKVKGGEVILLNGDLGCGKTVFAKGFAQGIGIKEPVTSPTFTIVNKYVGKIVMYHFDMYRLEDEEEALAAGLDELIDEKGAVKLIEWSEKVPGLLPQDCIVINMSKIDDQTRSIDIKGINV